MSEAASGEPSTREGHHKSLFRTTLSGQPSCIAFAPNHQDLFVIGTYQLDESTEVGNEADNEIGQNQSRSGTVQLFRLERDGKVTHLQTHNLEPSRDQDSQRRRSPGAILDLRFCTLSKYRDYFALCTSTGLIFVFRLNITENSVDKSLQLQLLRTYTLFEDETLLTSLSWDPNPSLEDEADVAVTLSDGRVAVVGIPLATDTKSKAEVLTTSAHHAESAWIAQWCPATNSGERRLATGGDDGAIHVVTVSSNESRHEPESSSSSSSSEHEDEDQALHVLDIHAQQNRLPTVQHLLDTRTHEAGVTSILPLTTQTNGELILVTGSYDNNLRVLETRVDSRRWHTLSEYDLGGGVWKLDLLATRDGLSGESQSSNSSPNAGSDDNMDQRWLVLASCMHAGVRVVEIRRWWNTQDEWKIEYKAGFSGHGSMCYASAAVPLTLYHGEEEKKDVWRVVSTSFYDRLLCVWDFKWYHEMSS